MSNLSLKFKGRDRSFLISKYTEGLPVVTLSANRKNPLPAPVLGLVATSPRHDLKLSNPHTFETVHNPPEICCWAPKKTHIQ